MSIGVILNDGAGNALGTALNPLFVSGGGSGGGVNSVTATLPLTSSGGANPNISANYNAANGIPQLDAGGALLFSQINAGLLNANATININAQKITNAALPTVASDLTTKGYVDALVQGLLTKAPVRLATAAALPANNNVAGVLTATAFGALTVDGVAVVVGDRILVKNEVASQNDGIFTVTATGGGAAFFVLTRSTDMNTSAEFPGAYVLSLQGTANTNRGWTLVLDPDVAFVVNVTAQTWLQFTGVGDITAGNGITITGNTISVSTTLPDNYTMSAAGIALTVTNGATISGTLTNSTHTSAAATALNLTGLNNSTWQVTGGTLTVQTTSNAMTLQTVTSGTLAVTSAGALNLTGVAASTHAYSGGAYILQTTSQNLTVQTVTSGTLAFTSAGAVNISAAAACSWTTSSGAVTIDAATSINIGTTNSTGLSLARAGQSTTANGSFRAAQDFRLLGIVSPTGITGTQNNYAPAASQSSIIRQALTGAATITGLSISQNTGFVVYIYNLDTTNSITITSEDAGSTAANRFTLTGTITISPSGCRGFWYDNTSSRWRTLS